MKLLLANAIGVGLMCFAAEAAPAGEALVTGKPAKPGGAVVFHTAMAGDEDPLAAGKAAATALKAAMGGVEPHVVLVSECFEDKSNKEKVLDGIAAVFPRDRICGGASYGMFTQEGVMDLDAVALLGIGGDGIGVSIALEQKMGAAGLSLEENEKQLTKALNDAGARLAGKIPGLSNATLMIVIADAHSPKNQLLLDGIQSVAGKKLRLTGGCVNKNAGQNWVYFRGRPYTDGVVAVTLTGDFQVAQAGRQAKDNDAVISTAKDGAAAAKTKLGKAPFAVLAFDCAGRMGKLDNVDDELTAMQAALGKTVPLFGCYCAGEYGPADPSEEKDEAACYGRGWHVMVSALGK